MLAAAAGESSSSRKRCRHCRTELCGQHAMHAGRGQRRRRFLQSGERGPVGSGDLFRQGRLEDGQRLSELHGPTLELAEHLEQMLCRALLDVG